MNSSDKLNENNRESGYLTDILSNFCIEDINLIKPYGSGHINETYYVKNVKEGGINYLLQSVNNHVFRDVPALIENVKHLTGHLKKKLESIPGSQPDKEVLTLVPTKDGQFYYLDNKGKYWRMYHFMDNTKSYDIVETEQQAREGGKAFGRFQALLVDLDIALITETIPNFHNIKIRSDRFDKSIHDDVVGRVKEAMPEIAFIKECMEEVLTWGDTQGMPLRIVHNDTKFNNVLLDENDHAQCVIDLDTVMPGYVAYDFGDSIRTIINTAAEDEADLSKINLNIPLFKSYARGYFEEARAFLTDKETESLLTGAFLITFEQAVRFLTDYLDGDVYYKIHFPEHNLQRTRAQIHLFKKLEASKTVLQEIMQNITKGVSHLQ